MKMTIALLAVAFVAGAVPGLASAQTNPGPPPPVKGQTAAKSAKGIPPAPPISGLRSRRRKSSSADAAKHIPGHDDSGRIDMSAKPVGFYPAAKGASPSNLGNQQSAIKTGTKRVAKQEN